MSVRCKGIVVGGVQSGVGKTSVALGLVAALRERGLRVQTFKVGPDFLDPTHLERASGRPCYNLDTWMAGPEHVRDVFTRACDGADAAVVEGVMGLFDGADACTLEGSTAEVAKVLALPVLLVANAHGSARSLAAVVHGFNHFEPGVTVAGIVANQVGSESHAGTLAKALAAAALPPLLGALPRGALPQLASRHLGLVSASADTLSAEAVAGLAASVAQHVDLDRLLRIAEPSPLTHAGTERPKRKPRVRVGLAVDRAFHFYYQDNLDALCDAGAELVPFSPIGDLELPPQLDALWLGGGYPELHAEELCNNESMCRCVRDFARSGRMIYAECGGLIYLSQGVELLDATRHRLIGVLPSWVRLHARRRALGYVEVKQRAAGLWGPQGEHLRGHVFHYSDLLQTPDGWQQSYTLRRRRDGKESLEGFRCRSTLASYVHLHFASQPLHADAFVNAAAGSGQ